MSGERFGGTTPSSRRSDSIGAAEESPPEGPPEGDELSESLGLRAIAQNAGLTLVRMGTAIVLGLGVAVLLARVLEPEGYGQYELAILLPMLLSTFLNLGVAPANIYFVGRGSASVQTALDSSVRLWALLSGSGLLIAAVAIAFRRETLFPGVPAEVLWSGMVAFPVALLQAFLTSLLVGVQDFTRYNKALLSTPVATLALAVVLVWALDGGVVAAVATYIGSHIIALGYTWRLLASHVAASGPDEYDSGTYMRDCIGYGWKVHLSNIIAFANYRADVFLLNLFLTPAAVGLYMVAVHIAERLWTLSASVSTVILPRLSQLHEQEEQRKRITPIIGRWVLYFSVLGGGVLMIAAPALIAMLFGDDYATSARVLRWLMPGIVLGSMSKILGNDIAARGRPEVNSYASVAVVTVNITANVLLIPRFGVIGAAAATSIAYSLHAFLMLGLYAWLSGNKWWRPIVYDPIDVTLGKRAAALLFQSRRT